MKIPILLGTARNGNQSQHVAKLILDRAQTAKIDSQIVKPQDHLDHPATARVGKEITGPTSWQQIMNEAVGLIIVTPEYNHGFPGELKLMLDLLYSEYANKPVGIVGVSDGGVGGARVVELLYPVLIGLEMQPIKQAVYFTNVNDLIASNGKITDQTFIDRVDKFLEKLKQQV